MILLILSVCLCFYQQELVPNIYFTDFLQCANFFINNKTWTLYTIFCLVGNVVNKNIFVWLFTYLDFTRIKISYIGHAIEKNYQQFLIIGHAIEKKLLAVFNINFFYTVHFILIRQCVFLSNPISCIILITTNRNDN